MQVLTSCTASSSRTTPPPSPATVADHSCNSGAQLLAALWRHRTLSHFIGALDRQSGQFRNISVKDASNTLAYTRRAFSDGLDVFFACAEYLTPDRRVAANVSGACAFWLDIDCSKAKADANKGYATEEKAELALRKFCDSTGLPMPTHVVLSGGGFHVFWALRGMVERPNWQAHAKKLKALTRAQGLLADDSRTADIASVLRIPGTLNFKYEPPRPVVLKSMTDDFIEPGTMLAVIDRAHASWCCPPPPLPVSSSGKRSARTAHSKHRSPDLVKLASALATLDPDCDEPTWTLRRLAPMAGAAREFPECGDALRDLARSWSSGKLRGNVARAWVTPGNNGRTGHDVFNSVWQRFLSNHYQGRPATLGTIYFDARAAGWSPATEQFEKVGDTVQGGGL